MHRAAIGMLLSLALILLGTGLALADSRAYERPIETVWDHAVKAITEVNFVLIDADRAAHELTMRSKSKWSHKQGLVMEVRLSGDHTHATIKVRAADPEQAEKAAKRIQEYLDALDRRLD